MSPTRPAARALVVAIVVVLLAGCAPSPGPAPTKATRTPSASASPSRTPDADEARVEIDGKGVTVYDADGESVLELDFTDDAQTARERLASALQEQAQSAIVTTDHCYQQLDESSWGGLHLWSTADGLRRPEDARFYVTADAAATGGGVPIRIPSGQSVGATKGQTLGANADAPSFSDGDRIDLHYDIESGSASGDPNDYYGALAQIVGTRLAVIDSPVYYSRPC